jgi:hypothetical protein
MGSYRPRHYYDDETLRVMEEALRDVWAILKAHQPYPGWQSDPELKAELAYHLMALADAGVLDLAELRARALRSLPLARAN